MSNVSRNDLRIISVANQKGGVGKTTTAINLGAALAARGLEVLIMDLDPQGNASTGLGIDPTARDRTTYDLFLEGAKIEDIAKRTAFAGLSVIPADTDISSVDARLFDQTDRLKELKAAFARSSIQADIILIDCPPALNLLTLNAFVASHAILVPLQAEFFALEGLSQLLLTVKEVRGAANPSLRVEGVVLTMFDGRNNLSRQVEDDVRATLGDIVYETKIPRNVRLSEAPSYAMPILAFDPNSRGAIAYRSLAGEFLRRNPTRLETEHV